LAIYSSQRSFEWKGEIEFEDSVRVIKNPREPLYGELNFELMEDLSIGKEAGDNYLFYRVRDIAVDYEGNIYVADMSDCRVQKFNIRGTYLKTIGRRGHGPGEFESPRKVRIHSETGNIYVLDGTYSVEVFNRNGRHLKEIRTKNWLADFRLSNDESIIGTLRIVSEDQLKASIGTLNSNGELSESYAKFPYNRYMDRREKGVILVYTGYEQELLLAGLSNERFVFGHSREYRLSVIRHSGPLIFKITRDIPPVEFSRKEKRKLKKLNLGDYKPFFYSIMTDSEGRIYIQTNKTWNEEKVKEKEVDIYSSNGHYLYAAKLPRNTYVIEDGYLYALEVDDEELVNRYKIKNWNQIKTGIN
jgi:hypothetical protein